MDACCQPDVSFPFQFFIYVSLILITSVLSYRFRTKFALSSRPLNIMLEIILDVEPGVLSPSTYRKRRRPSGTHSVLSGASGGSLEHGDVTHVEPESIGVLSRKATILVIERMCACQRPFSVSMSNLTWQSLMDTPMSMSDRSHLISAGCRGRVSCDHGS